MTTKVSALLLMLAACGDNQAGLGPDAGAAAPDGPHGTRDPVPTGDQPQVGKGPGDPLATPRVVPIFFANDATMQAQVEQFLAALAPSEYWHATTSEYGIGAPTIASTIVTTATPPTTDAALQQLLVQNLTGTNPAWETFDPNTIYAVYLPDGVVLNAGGPSCQAWGGYHDEVTIQGAPPIAYALLPRCQGGLDTLTVVTSHELIEAASDPHPETATAWGDHMDPNHLVWAFTPGAELGDMCEYVHAAEQRDVGNFLVQRTWSNKSAKHGHDPCVPALATPYVVAIPQMTDDLSIPDGNGGTISTKGVSIPVGMSKTNELDLFSDVPVDMVQVKAIDASSLGGGGGGGPGGQSGPELVLTLDKDMGGPGDKMMLTIKRMKAGFGGNEFVVSTRVNGTSVALWWGLVAN
jgi:hypothetical protein